ncbi:unnamed protein product (macronuclear) [Paramecium tetraurelia]|uniref:Uncharacterized protein n=1 Tax=Paramecium tetraurelia TaxID=5888 RepID=A0BQB2_PARTE|nr:uncharacterized protein GSPATT00030958001 [Paramecium tetraurelia]CAK60729.1 unnamed protein product [Paramecium tetraurelia]|eukprot:XP_001428127.1 hypothetical protein (macronuclear) [Paramecium tetraurelia strain d4-2]
MSDQINVAIIRLNQERKLLKERQNTFNSESSQNNRTVYQKQRLSTLDPPKLFMQIIQVPYMKNQRPIKVKTKLKVNINFRRRSLSQKTEKISNAMVGVVRKFDLSFLNYDPLPIVYYNQGKMLKQKRQGSNIISI